MEMRYGGPSVVVWVDRMFDSRTDMYVFHGSTLTALSYRTEILQTYVILFRRAVVLHLILWIHRAFAMGCACQG